MEKNDSYEQDVWHRWGIFISWFVVVVLVSLCTFAIYGASQFYTRAERAALVKSRSSKIIQQEAIIKNLSKMVVVAENDARESEAEAQNLLRAHKWVGIFRSVLPECIDDNWNGGVKEDENKNP